MFSAWLGMALAVSVFGGGTMETLEGRVSTLPAQHPMDAQRAGRGFYFDPVEGDQRVVYRALGVDAPPQGAWLRVTMYSFTFEVRSKRPGASKAWPETQYDATLIERLPASDTVEALVEKLGRDDVALGAKGEIKDAILNAGWSAFPVLVAHLHDDHIYERGHDVQNRLGLPAHLPPPKPILADITVGSEVQRLLHRLIIPAGGTRTPAAPRKPKGEMFAVKDWRAWWMANRHKSLGQIHRELEPRAALWWETGDTQVLN